MQGVRKCCLETVLVFCWCCFYLYLVNELGGLYYFMSILENTCFSAF